MRSLDEALEDVGDFGAYQKKLYYFLIVTATFPVMQKWLWDFITITPPHRCKFPFEVATNSTTSFFRPEDIINSELPEQDGFSSPQLEDCITYHVENKSDILRWTKDPEYLLNTTQACSSWVYDTENERTVGIVSDFNVVCERSYLIPLSKKIYTWCEIIGYILWGVLSDRFGRKKVFFVSLVLQSLSGFFAGMVASLTGVIAMRGAIALFASGGFIGAILRIEFVGPSMRMVTGMMDLAMAATGNLVLAFMVFLFSKWRHLQIVSSIPAFLFLSCWWFVPESARWLLAHRKEREARRIISKMANKNHEELTFDSYESEDEPKIPYRQSNPINLCCFTETRKRLLILIIMWLTSSISFHSISYKWMPEMSSDRLVQFVLNSLMEQPAFIMSLFTLNRYGKRFPIAIALISTACLLVIFAAVPSDSYQLKLALMIFSKISCTGAIAALYVFSIELQSTSIRGCALGILFAIFIIGDVVVPFIQLLAGVWEVFPVVLTAALSVVSGFLVFLLPETTGYLLAERLQDVEIPREEDELDETAFSGRRVSIHLRNSTPDVKLKVVNQETTQDFVQP